MIAEFNKLSRDIPISGYEGMRAIHLETYKKIMEIEKNLSHLEGMQQGLSKAETILNQTLNKI